MKTPIVDYLMQHEKEKPISFHMPGHKGMELYKRYGYDDFIAKMMDCDITEIIGADNLFQAEGIIRAAQERYAALYDVKKSYFLINGTSGGIIASILAAVPAGKKIIMARNCHKSVFNALTLKDIQPVYAYPDMIEGWGVTGGISPCEIEKLLSEDEDVEAVILPSPNYYGVCSDIKAISEIIHNYQKILIVDQAHGAHLKFFGKHGILGFPKSAEEQGADIVINSIHKTLASFTQSAVLNLNSDRIPYDVLEDKLQVIESSSPSYLLMASLDINASILIEHGKELMYEWKNALDYFYNEVRSIEGLKVCHDKDQKMENGFGFAGKMDSTKINLDMSALGINGHDLEQRLLRYNIFAELTTGDILMCMTGLGSTKEHMKKLIFALSEIAAEARNNRSIYEGKRQEKSQIVNRRYGCKHLVPKAAELCEIPRERKRILLEHAAGEICASSIIPYPPGIPIICPGERMTQEIIDYVTELRSSGEKVIGINDRGQIFVGR